MNGRRSGFCWGLVDQEVNGTLSKERLGAPNCSGSESGDRSRSWPHLHDGGREKSYRIIGRLRKPSRSAGWRRNCVQTGPLRMRRPCQRPRTVGLLEKLNPCLAGALTNWRRRRDSNPRCRFKPACSLSRGVPSTTRPRLRTAAHCSGMRGGKPPQAGALSSSKA
jgi:hypothetical protein